MNLIKEIATRARSADYWATGYYLPNPDPILKKMGKDISVYRELLSDGQVRAGVRRRKAAVKGLEWKLTPSGNEAVDDVLSQLFTRLPLKKIISEMMNAALFGYQIMEIMWEKRDGLILPAAIKSKKPEWFVFDEDNRLRFKSKEEPISGELLPEKKFLIITQEASDDNPYGMGDLALCFWAATFKKGGLKFWLEFTEKYGSPWLIGKHPRTAQIEDKSRIADSLESMVSTAIAVIPDDASIEILEAAGKSSSSETFNDFLNFCKAEINIALLGQNQTTEQESNRASAQAGMEVIADILNDDKAMIETAFNQLLKMILSLNFAPLSETPTFELFEQEQIDQIQVERDCKLHQMGVRFSQNYFEREYGFEEGDIERIDDISGSLKTDLPLSFAENKKDKTQPEKIIQQLSTDTRDSVDKWFDQVRDKMQNADSLEDFRDGLDSILTDLDFEEYADVLARAMLLSDFAGRADVLSESKK